MPIYEYHCDKCEKDFEHLQKISDEPKSVCKDCKTATLTKKVSAGGFQLVGTGWHNTDYPKR